MIMKNIKQLKQILTSVPGRVMGLDIGEKTIGVALSDRGMKIASPQFTLNRTSRKKNIRQLIDYATENDVVGFVIGLPLNMDGTEGVRCVMVRTLAGLLAEHTTLPIFFQDERFSTIGVERELIAIDMTRQRRAQIIDKLAASKILQTVLDQLI
jgi:putative Holliday junction resolvase